MKSDRRLYWLGGAVLAAGVALAAGVPLATILTIALVLACPAAMFFGMGMMGRPRASEQNDGMPRSAGPQQPQGEVAVRSAAAALPEATADGADPVAILKIRLAKGEITPEDYDRLVARISAPDPITRKD